MAPKFGTSGLRGLVTELSDALVARHTAAFLATCDHGGRVWLGEDLRPSSPAIAQVIAATASAQGVAVIRAGALPTPALAHAAAQDGAGDGAGAIMVTGSHIPADRNGIKFYTRAGEITKSEEEAISAALETPLGQESAPITEDAEAGARFMARYVTAFGAAALSGLKLGVYTHSAVGRDLLMEVLGALGAEVTEFGRSDTFIPVDTEAVEPEARARFTGWAAGLDALVSTDGDSDRPMVTDATGRVIPGDILGQITARYLGADTIVTPISSNSSVTERGFEAVHLTRIGSPFVIAGMEAATGRVAGYEANGGFLLGFEAAAPGPLPALMTRDSFLPIIAPLAMARAAGQPLAALAAQETLRHTAADRLTEMPMAASQALLGQLRDESDARARLLSAAGLGAEANCDETDGLRMTDATGAVLHLRPSGNAPELRLYVEARSPAQAEDVLTAAKRAVAERL